MCNNKFFIFSVFGIISKQITLNDENFPIYCIVSKNQVAPSEVFFKNRPR